ncbi:hypothetical protein L6452_35321 [Arctium lappa]|uniref:Uncharacterized protein n=1 Tax=Arctium lappa TaxID=4217 RepID=A0ACB8Y7B2_ARCLA|nr:hypothetical protein L6452_35321 [Arctium lappa]
MESVIIFMLSLLLFLSVSFLFRGKKYSDKIPPGSLGLPLIGQSLGLLKALKADKVEEWFQEGITKHGPIWKTGLFGYPTVVLHGATANKFVYACDGSVLSITQPPSVSRIVGSKNILELVNEDHKRVRAALVSFLRLEVLKQYVTKVDEEIQYHLQMHWVGKHEVQIHGALSNWIVFRTMELVVIFTLSLLLLSVFFLFRGKKYSDNIPPGSLGLPLIGQSLSLLKAMKSDKVEEWFQEGITKHGPIWKTGLFGYPTVVLHGTTANKFFYTCDGSVLSNTQPPSISRIVGLKNILELVNDDHKRVRAALVSFLKLEVLKQYVAKVDEEIQYHLQMHWAGKHVVQVQTLIKTLTFNVICSLLFGIERGPKRENLLPLFQHMIEGMLAIPINLPFTQFNRGIIARKKLVPMLIDLIREKREAIKEQKRVDPHKDLITSLLSICDEDSSTTMSDEEIIDNFIVVMIAGYDTTSVLLTFLVRLLATDESIYSAIAREQGEIAKNKTPGEALTWEDLTKMKYTWRVASEMLRINPPVVLSFRRTVQDIEYGGYIIPKGWQILVSQSMTHMDNSIFQNPTMFNPTRFEKNAPSPPPFCFVAFGAGPRMCPGIEFAKMETLAMMHRLVTQFTWVLFNNDEPFKRIPMPEFDKGLTVRIMPIKASSMPSEAMMQTRLQ